MIPSTLRPARSVPELRLRRSASVTIPTRLLRRSNTGNPLSLCSSINCAARKTGSSALTEIAPQVIMSNAFMATLRCVSKRTHTACLHDFVTLGLVMSRSRIGGEPAIECEIAPRRGVPPKLAVHCPSLHLAQQHRLSIEGKRPIEAIQHRRSAGLPEHKRGGMTGPNTPLGRVNDGVGQAAHLSH